MLSLDIVEHDPSVQLRGWRGPLHRDHDRIASLEVEVSLGCVAWYKNIHRYLVQILVGNVLVRFVHQCSGLSHVGHEPASCSTND